MVCSSAMSFDCIWLQILFCSRVNETTLFSFLRSLLRENDRWLSLKKNTLGDRVIKQLLNSVIAKYRDLLVSRRSIICLSVRLRQIIDLLATDKSRYFAQPHPIIANYWQRSVGFRSQDLQDERKDKNNAYKGCASKEIKINCNKEMLLISLLQTFIRRTLVSVGWFLPYDAWNVIISVMQASLQINKIVVNLPHLSTPLL